MGLQLKRLGSHDVILKQLKNVESADRSWFDEICILNFIRIITLLIKFSYRQNRI